MRQFRFTLEKILKLRAYEEREIELELGKITSLCIGIRNRIEDRKREKREAFLTRQGKTYDSAYLAVVEVYEQRMVSLIEADLRELGLKERERERIQQKYLEASRNRKVLDKLKERQRQAYYRMQLAGEAKELDDMNSGREARNRTAVRRDMEWQAER